MYYIHFQGQIVSQSNKQQAESEAILLAWITLRPKYRGRMFFWNVCQTTYRHIPEEIPFIVTAARTSDLTNIKTIQ
jgi:hypothetical protein